MTTETIAKRDIQKLQRAIVDGLEDVKAQDIQVFNTEHLTALFERVIVASGTSNRQTKALAASVRDAVKEDGFPKPRVEGEENGEWIIVDCGQAVVHIMQPSIRQYYHLEELWGDKPVRLKFGADKPAVKAPAKTPVKTPAKASTIAAARGTPKASIKPETNSAPTTAAKGKSLAVGGLSATGNLRRASAAKAGVAEAFPSRAQVAKNAAAKASAAKRASGPAKPPAKPSTARSVVKPGASPVRSKSAPKVMVLGSADGAKTAARKAANKPVPAESAPNRKSAVAKKVTAAKKAVVR